MPGASVIRRCSRNWGSGLHIFLLPIMCNTSTSPAMRSPTPSTPRWIGAGTHVRANETGQPVAWKYRGDQYLKPTDGPEPPVAIFIRGCSYGEDAGAVPICTFARIARLRGKQAETTQIDPVAPVMMAEDPPHSLDPDRSLDQVIAVR